MDGHTDGRTDISNYRVASLLKIKWLFQFKYDNENCAFPAPIYWNFTCTDLPTFCKSHEMDDCDYPLINDSNPRLVSVEQVKNSDLVGLVTSWGSSKNHSSFSPISSP